MRAGKPTTSAVRRLELARRLSRLHLHVRRQREDFQNKLVHRIFKESDVLVLEKLGVSGMLRNHRLAKSISDASWSRFSRRAVFKAGLLGKQTVFVDPWGTTQFCHDCLTWVPKDLGRGNTSAPTAGRNTKRHELRSSHQEAWHPEKKPGPGRGLVTRRARASALPQGDGKSE